MFYIRCIRVCVCLKYVHTVCMCNIPMIFIIIERDRKREGQISKTTSDKRV